MQRLLDLFGRCPKVLEDVACDIFGSKASLVLTNVKGPRDDVQLAGIPVDRLMFCVPHAGQQIGMGASIMSYRGMATLTIVRDTGLVFDPHVITREFNREVAAMSRPKRRGGPAAGSSHANV
jgi:diacylglycerol O-acyltransferase / wax synthase